MQNLKYFEADLVFVCFSHCKHKLGLGIRQPSAVLLYKQELEIPEVTCASPINGHSPTYHGHDNQTRPGVKRYALPGGKRDSRE